MRLVGLISGGKDSIYNMLQCIAAGHEMVAVANIEPEASDVLDSYMFQTAGHEAISLVSLCLGLPIFRQKTKGLAFCKDKVYDTTAEDEVEDLFELLSEVKKKKNIDGVSVGAIASDYQRTRVENVCSRLGLVCFAYLWKRDQVELLQEMINAQVDAIIIKVACIGLNPTTHLGMRIKDIQPHLLELNTKYGVNVCGEGGEYETLTLNSPLYTREIEISESETVISSNDAFAPVGFLLVKKATLHLKSQEKNEPFKYLDNLKVIQSMVKNPYDYVQDCLEKDSENKLEAKIDSVEDLPFPFETEEGHKSEIPTVSSLQIPIKGSSKSVMNLPKLHELIENNLPKCQVSNSSGWCSIVNMTGATVMDVFQSLKKLLEKFKYNFNDVVFVSLYIKDMSEFSKINKVYSQFMPVVSPPARVCVAIELPSNTEVLISLVAHRMVSKSHKLLHVTKSLERDALHVRSISHWAPANIGPYSQCMKIGSIYYLAGQIPLIPGTMEILEQSIFSQCKLTFRSILRIMEAMDGRLNFSNVLQAVCYVTSKAIASDVVGLWTFMTKAKHSTVTSIVVKALPKNAVLEWEILACNADKPEVEERTDKMEDFVLHMKRCVYKDVFASSLVCNFCIPKKTSKKNVQILPFEELNEALNNCIHFLLADSKINTHLCIMKLFYESRKSAMLSALKNLTFSCTDSKVSLMMIPVDGCQTPECFITVIGVCH